ncbi:MAG: CHAT domain-containing protein [Blastocatellia bacterium]|nr:CHAT domain-containing protein [Blastocatellia bacterium]
MSVRSQAQFHQLVAGGMFYLSRLSWLLIVIGLSHTTPAQTISSSHIPQDFLATLMRQSSTTEIAVLLDSNPTLVTPLLWQTVSDKATGSYYEQSPDHAIALHQTALLVAERLSNKRYLAQTYYNLGQTYSGTGKMKEAIAAYLASKDAFDMAGFPRDGIYLLSDLGALYFNLEQYAQARQCAEQSLTLAKALQHSNAPAALWPDDYGIAGASSLLGALEWRAGKHEQAIAYLKDATAIYLRLTQAGLKLGYQIADSLAETGRVYRDMGENATALTFLQQALLLAHKLPQPDLANGIRNSIGGLYLEQDDYDQAEPYFQQALQGYQRSGNQTEAAGVILNLGVTAQRRNIFSSALDFFQQAIQQATQLGNQEVRVAAGEGLGVIYREKGDYSAAWQVLEQSLSLAKASQNKMREAELLWRMAEVHLAQNAFTQAAELATQARQIAQQQRLPKLSYLTAVTLGEAYLRLKKIPQALEILNEAAQQLEALRTRVAGAVQERQLFFTNKVAAYHLQIELLLQQGKILEALQAAERAKARVLFDALQRGSEPVDEQFLAGCKPPTLHPTELGRLVSPKSALLIYTVTPEQTFLFVLKNAATVPEIHTFVIPITAQELRNRAHLFHQQIAERRPAFAIEARALYRLLLQPVAAVLQGVEGLCIIPDDGLWEVPFQALQTSTGRYVVEDYAVRYAPSLSVLTSLANQPQSQSPKSLLAFGNPATRNYSSPPFAPLPEAEKEVVAIGKLFGSAHIFTSEAATEGRFKALAARHGILHLATHGVLNNRQPLDSYLALSNSNENEDGRLTAREIMQTRLKANLAVLSACETAQGNIRAGEGVVGLSWAFFLAGCRTLVVSQWQVNSASTADLMVSFFAQRQRQGQNAQALREAALKLMQQPRYQHPYYWASFVTMGAP